LVEAAPGTGDSAYDGPAYAGLQECRRQTGAEITALAAASPADYAPKLTLLATENYDAVLAAGFSMAPDVYKIARRFENTHFAMIDAVVDLPNVESITFNEPEGAFLAGALAAMMSTTGAVAFLGGADVPLLQRSEAGFTAGARQVDPRIRVAVRYLTSFEDPAGGRRAADALFGAGAGVLYVVAGKSGLGAIDAAKGRRGGYVIGVDSDQDALAPGKVLTSVVKHVGAATLRVCQEIAAQKPFSGHVVLGLADGGIGLTGFAYTSKLIGPARLARLARIRSAIVARAIVPPATRAALRAFKPVPLP
jgi:basic membrane protein A